MSRKSLYPGASLIRIYTTRDEDNILYDPTELLADIVDSGSQIQAQLVTKDFTKLSSGRYRLHYNLPLDAKVGVWHIHLTATYTKTTPVLVSAHTYSFSVAQKPTIGEKKR